jgi:hypothetical protein
MTWQPGKSGNPKGRPRGGHALSEILRDRLFGDPRYAQALISKLLALGMEGNLSAICAIMDRLEGRAAQQIFVSDNDTPRVVRMPIAGPLDETIGMEPPDNDDDAADAAASPPTRLLPAARSSEQTTSPPISKPAAKRKRAAKKEKQND